MIQRTEEKKKMMHVGLCKGDVSEYVFLPGSPERAEAIARHLTDTKEMAYNREFRTFTGLLNDKRVSVCSTGIGGPSTAIAVEELVQLGAHTLLRVGSCIATNSSVKKGDIIIPIGAVRMEGVSYQYETPEFPAVPDPFLVGQMEEAAAKIGFPTRIGIAITRSSFYAPLRPSAYPQATHLKETWEAFVRGGALCTDMDSSVLFIVGACLDVRTASVLVSTTDGQPDISDIEDCSPDLEERVIEVALEAMRRIVNES